MRSGPNRRWDRTEHGAGTVLALGLGMVLLLGFLVIALLAQAGTLASRAAAAADLAALAAADAARGLRDGEPCALASEIAGRNGARVDSCTVTGPEADIVEVHTGIDGVLGLAHATGRARAGPPP
ncbi:MULTISPECIES: Rv3654c family TadE-like protein [Arthrobacter]|uniref:Rv3654c family TadE-like protein n=2 Tax=Arthrobacter TaxID=1663 RepID=A0ABU9KKY4_9MICC|nr:Rv3654c family TadE-like protein [Arthrobacter sp. YJM1]MDP5227571.1 flp pilus-assembly TadE/G-like family protein [Arthrobacter sp. YJM1]